MLKLLSLSLDITFVFFIFLQIHSPRRRFNFPPFSQWEWKKIEKKHHSLRERINYRPIMKGNCTLLVLHWSEESARGSPDVSTSYPFSPTNPDHAVTHLTLELSILIWDTCHTNARVSSYFHNSFSPIFSPCGGALTLRGQILTLLDNH